MKRSGIILLFISACLQGLAQNGIPLPDSSDYYIHNGTKFVQQARRIFHYNNKGELDTTFEKIVNTDTISLKISYAYHSSGRESSKVEEYRDGYKYKYEKRYDNQNNMILDDRYNYDTVAKQFVRSYCDSMVIQYDAQKRPIVEIIYRWNDVAEEFYLDSKSEFLDYDAKGPRLINELIYKDLKWEPFRKLENVSWYLDFDLYRLKYDNLYAYSSAYISVDWGSGLNPTRYEGAVFKDDKLIKFSEIAWSGTNLLDTMYSGELTYDKFDKLKESYVNYYNQGKKTPSFGEKYDVTYGVDGEKRISIYYKLEIPSGKWDPEEKEVFYYRIIPASGNATDILTFKAYPNPVTDLLTLEGDFGAQNSICIYDINGRKHKEIILAENDHTLYLGDMKDGVYFLEITNEKGRTLLRIVK